MWFRCLSLLLIIFYKSHYKRQQQQQQQNKQKNGRNKTSREDLLLEDTMNMSVTQLSSRRPLRRPRFRRRIESLCSRPPSARWQTNAN